MQHRRLSVRPRKSNMDKYFEKLCDERHKKIDKRLGEIRLISYGIIIVLVASLLVGVIEGDPLLTSKLILSLIKLGG